LSFLTLSSQTIINIRQKKPNFQPKEQIVLILNEIDDAFYE